MASKNIAIRDDLYARLDKLKEKNESFSDVIERLLDGSPKGSFNWVKKCLGRWQDLPEPFFEIMGDARMQFDQDLGARLKGIRDQ